MFASHGRAGCYGVHLGGVRPVSRAIVAKCSGQLRLFLVAAQATQSPPTPGSLSHQASMRNKTDSAMIENFVRTSSRNIKWHEHL